MTTRDAALPLPAPVTGFAERPPRMDMQNILFLHRPGHITALARHLGKPDTTLVFGEIPIDWRPGQRDGQLYPDLLVAFNVDVNFAIGERGFAIDNIGKPPDFVLEVASVHTAQNDYINKRGGYADYGIPEYWRFDNTGGRYYPEPLAGDRLVNGEYQPIAIAKVDEERYWGHSDALNLDLCWEYGHLRWWDPVAQHYLNTHDDEADARIAAEAQAAEAQTQAAEAQTQAAEAQTQAAEAQTQTAEAQTQAAEAQTQTAEAQTQAAEAQAQAAEAQARIRQLEEKLRQRSQ